MRIRSKTNSSSFPVVPAFTQEWVGHQTYTVPSNGTVVSEYDVETMSDDINKGRHFKEVVHERKVLTKSAISADTLVSGSETFISSGSNCFWHIWGLGANDFASHAHISKSWPISENTLLRQTMDDFFNVNNVDNVLNTVESPELVTSMTSMSRQIKLMPIVTGRALRRNALGRFEILPKLLSQSVRRDIARAGGFISGGFLYYTFGIAPILADMRKIAKQLKTYKSKLRAVTANAGQPVSVHRQVFGSFGTFGSDGAQTPGGGFAFSPNTGGTWNASTNVLVTPVMTCTVRGVRDIKYLSEGFQTLDYLISRFGGVGPASFAWERIPFSFVLDWFVDLSGVLNALDNALTGNRKNIQEAGISQKWKCLVPVVKIQPSSTLTDSNDGSQIALCELSHYSRHTVDPVISIGLTDRFGKKQGFILGALISQMAANLVLRKR
jgi:hypothetical protein